MNSIPLLVPDLPDTNMVLPYLKEIDTSKWYTNFGPLVARLETNLTAVMGGPPLQAVSVANCTLGLELSLAALNLPRQARVLVPALTFAASATAVLRAGGQPVLADVDSNNWLLTPEIARATLRHSKLDCVMPVATFGCSQPTEEWDAFTRESGVPVIVDAAGAFGNQRIGELNTVVFSLHATKAFGIGEGGLVVSRDRNRIAQIRQLSNFGIDLSLGMSRHAGTNAKMSEYHAAVGLAVLARWPERQIRRRELALKYEQMLRMFCPRVTLQARPADGIYTIMQLLLPDGVESRHVRDHLYAMRIETRSWYLPLLIHHPAFSECMVDGDLSVSRMLAPRMLGLPFHLELHDGDIERICKALSNACKYCQ